VALDLGLALAQGIEIRAVQYTDGLLHAMDSPGRCSALIAHDPGQPQDGEDCVKDMIKKQRVV
jgi:hypothetical protein